MAVAAQHRSLPHHWFIGNRITGMRKAILLWGGVLGRRSSYNYWVVEMQLGSWDQEDPEYMLKEMILLEVFVQFLVWMKRQMPNNNILLGYFVFVSVRFLVCTFLVWPRESKEFCFRSCKGFPYLHLSPLFEKSSVLTWQTLLELFVRVWLSRIAK